MTTQLQALRWIAIAAVVVAIVMALIEWNARRQAAAMTRELLRPATIEEQQIIDDATSRMMQDVEQAFPETPAEVRDPARGNMGHSSGTVTTPVLNLGERCISGQRFRRVTNGWEEIGTC